MQHNLSFAELLYILAVSMRAYERDGPSTFTQHSPTTLYKQVIALGAARRYAPADGSSTRDGSTSVRGRVRSPHISGGRRWLSL